MLGFFIRRNLQTRSPLRMWAFCLDDEEKKYESFSFDAGI